MRLFVWSSFTQMVGRNLCQLEQHDLHVFSKATGMRRRSPQRKTSVFGVLAKVSISCAGHRCRALVFWSSALPMMLANVLSCPTKRPDFLCNSYVTLTHLVASPCSARSPVLDRDRCQMLYLEKFTFKKDVFCCLTRASVEHDVNLLIDWLIDWLIARGTWR